MGTTKRAGRRSGGPAGSPEAGSETTSPSSHGARPAVHRRSGQSIRSRWLGRRLVALREAAGFQARQAAASIERDSSTLSRYESGEYAIRRADLLALLEYYGVADQATRGQFLDLRDEAWQNGWWDEHPAVAGDQALADLIWLESRATSIQAFGLATVPELLRTPAHGEEVLRATAGELTPERLDGLLDLLRTRQRALAAGDPPDRPPALSVVLAEPALRAAAGTPGQLDRLAALAGQSEPATRGSRAEAAELPVAELRVLPDRARFHPVADTSFTLIGMPDHFPTVAHVATPGGPVFFEGAQAEPFTREFDRLYEASLAPAPSAAHLNNAVGNQH